ncbi:hypothetical protein E2986_10941, partial [Frieseomelitta varia]
FFPQAVLVAILAVATAAPGLAPIHAPVVVAHAPAPVAIAHAAPVAHVIAQPVAPIVRTAPIVTKSVVAHAPLPLLAAHSLH